MADMTKLIDLALLTVYDEQIKEYIGQQADTSSIHTVAKDSTLRKIYFYTEKPADVTVGTTTPAFTIDMTDIDTTIGTMTSLKTTEKTNLVGAINELYDAIDDIDLDAKADKVTGATEDNFAALDADGNLKDSGKKAADFATATDLGDVSTITVETASGVKATSAVAAINQLETEIGDALDDSAVTITEVTTGLASDVLKSYVFRQGGDGDDAIIGTINLAKDLVVTAGEVIVVDDEHPVEGLANGTYLKLTIANQEAPVYINVADLAHDYTPAASATQVQVAISEAREISATIVASSVTATELATDAVTEGKIAANAVTNAKLAENAVTATADAETGVITSTVLDDVVVGALNDAINALQEDDLGFATEAEVKKLFEVTP